MIRQIYLLLLSVIMVGCTGTLGKAGANSESDVRGYTGIGRISWQRSQDSPTIFAVPHFTSGPRLLCTSRKMECEISVYSRDVSISIEDRIEELRNKIAPELQHATIQTFQTLRHGQDKSVVYTIIEDSRTGEQFRFLTVGFATRGTAVIKFHALTNAPLDYIGVLDIVYRARAEDALEMWALRFLDYAAICAERFPEFAAANSNALLSSPLNGVNTVEFIRQMQPQMTKELAERKLQETRKGFAASFDTLANLKQRHFCQRIPDMLATVVSEREIGR